MSKTKSPRCPECGAPTQWATDVPPWIVGPVAETCEACDAKAEAEGEEDWYRGQIASAARAGRF